MTPSSLSEALLLLLLEVTGLTAAFLVVLGAAIGAGSLVSSRTPSVRNTALVPANTDDITRKAA